MFDRIDKILVDKKILLTRSQARMLIEQGDVYCNGVKVKKAGQKVSIDDHFEIKERSLYVSRGAYKLEKALDEFEIDPKGLIVCDVGASTGGFTQVLLEKGAKKVYCIDVGRDQLSPLIKEDPRVINLEGTNIKVPLELDDKADLCVVDLSFISLKLVFKNIVDLLGENGLVVALVKPQFEAGKERIGKNGIVKDEIREQVFQEVLDWMQENHFNVLKKTISPITGKTGNTEYLILVTKSQNPL